MAAGSDFRIIGLKSIAFGPHLVATAGMPTNAQMTSVISIVPDSAVLAIEMPGKTDIMVEDSDYPDITLMTPGAKFIEFATRDMTPQNFFLGMGGTTTATLWKAPVTAFILKERAVRAFTKSYGGKYARVDIKRAAVRAGGQLRFSKTESGTLSYQCDVLRPMQLATDSPIVMALVTG